jgi:hypothetical protein
VNVLDVLTLEPGAIYVMDRGYLDFAWLYLMHQTHAFFVTRAKSNTQLRRVYSAPVDRSAGIICDQTVALTGTCPRRGSSAVASNSTVQGGAEPSVPAPCYGGACFAGSTRLRYGIR